MVNTVSDVPNGIVHHRIMGLQVSCQVQLTRSLTVRGNLYWGV